jgi:hypothetical protein
VEPVVDLEEPSTVPLVAEDVLHVRLAGRKREQQARRQLVSSLRLHHDPRPAACTSAPNLAGQLIRCDVHRSSDLTVSSDRRRPQTHRWSRLRCPSARFHG